MPRKSELSKPNTDEQSEWNDQYLGHTNENNPFGDRDLTTAIVWHKKLEKEGKRDLTTREIKKMQKRKMEENKEELERIKKRRLEREKDKEDRDKTQELVQREKEAAYYKVWEMQEENFHLQQVKLRSKIRIGNGSAKPIDILAHFASEDDDIDVELAEPYELFNGLTIDDFEDLLEDIKVYCELEQEKNAHYWKDIAIIAEHELVKLKTSDPSCPRQFANRNPIISNPDARKGVEKTFENNSMPDLLILKAKIEEMLHKREGIVVGHWEDMLELLSVYMARRRLKDYHQEKLRNKLFNMKKEQCIENDCSKPNTNTEGNSPELTTLSKTSSSSPVTTVHFDEGSTHSAESEDQNDYVAGECSLVLLQLEDLPPGVIPVDPEEDLKRLEFARKCVLTTGKAEMDEEEEFMKRAKADMNNEECQFSVEVQLKSDLSIWSDKYKPRKPRYFNRVHTGYDWNKYNQTHYDVDNPPPKVVQGYKFNIYYPDLIDQTTVPQYKVTPCEDGNFAVIRFIAGPPYEDIAFKIVNREWDRVGRKGYRCQFQNKVLQLWFHFKRLRYRR